MRLAAKRHSTQWNGWYVRVGRLRDLHRCAEICYLFGADVAERLVRQGLARDCARYSDGRYEQAEMHPAAQGATIAATYELPGDCCLR